MTQHMIVTLASDLTWEQFLARLQPVHVPGTSIMCAVGRERRSVQLMWRRFADGSLHLIGTEPVSDRWYYRE